MYFLLHKADDSESYSVQSYDSEALLAEAARANSDISIADADTLLRLYVATERDTALYAQLQWIRDQYIDDLDLVETAAQIYGLIFWLLEDNGINAQGASLEQTADRLSDLDIEEDNDRYTDIIFHLKDAVDRLYELDME